MTWRVVSASAIGTSHAATGQDCQDSCWAQVALGANNDTLVVFVSDGAGSALRGGDGAELAMQVAADFIHQKLAQPEFGLNDEFAVECVIAIRERIFRQAELDGLKARDFACTFLGLISSRQGTLLMQIGDGGIVVDFGAGLELPIIPMTGEYANMTHFVTEEDALGVLVSKTFSEQVIKVAAFSDGIQRLALQMDTNTPHSPFFAPLFDVLTKAGTDKEDQLHRAMENFLNSDAINERTDDDKTLVLAVLAV